MDEPRRSLISRISKNATVRQIFRYGITAGISYTFIIGAMYVAVDIWNLPRRPSYAVVNAINYIGVYVSFCTFVFNDKMNRKTLTRFALFLAASWVVSYCFFWLIDALFDLHYVTIVILNIIVLGFIRFYMNKRYVFKT